LCIELNSMQQPVSVSSHHMPSPHYRGGDDQDDSSSMGSINNRYVLSEHPPEQQLPLALLKGGSRRKKALAGDQFDLRSLNELDEAVASVGKLYQSPRVPLVDDDLISFHTGMISTTNESLRKRNSSRSSSGAQSVVSSLSTRSKRSTRSRRRRQRGLSLERIISQTILETSVQDQDTEPLKETPQPKGPSADDILQDLFQVCTIMESEGYSTSSGSSCCELSSHLPVSSEKPGYGRFHSLLPPIVSGSKSYASAEDDLFHESPSKCKYMKSDHHLHTQPQRGDCFTPDTSAESRSAGASLSPPSSPGNPFDDVEQPQAMWLSADYLKSERAETLTDRYGDQNPTLLSLSSSTSASEAEKPTASKSRSWGKNKDIWLPQESSPAFSEWLPQEEFDAFSAPPKKTNVTNESATFFSSDEWTTFDHTPFGPGPGSDSDQSPLSVADFSALRQWKTSERGWKTPGGSVMTPTSAMI
jgi:hypothetical protein